jgi:hypothetical protein
VHINCLELLTIVVSLRTWGKYMTGKRILFFFCDNEASVQILNSGHTRCIYAKLLKGDLLLSSKYSLKSRLNTLVEKISCVTKIQRTYKHSNELRGNTTINGETDLCYNKCELNSPACICNRLYSVLVYNI